MFKKLLAPKRCEQFSFKQKVIAKPATIRALIENEVFIMITLPEKEGIIFLTETKMYDKINSRNMRLRPAPLGECGKILTLLCET